MHDVLKRWKLSCWFDGAVVVGGCGRHKGKMGGLAISEEIGLLDMSAKLISKYESIKVREGAGAPLHGCRPRVGAMGSGVADRLSVVSVAGLVGAVLGGCQERYSGFKPVTPGSTRQRGAKKAAAYHALSSYSVHFLQ